MVTIIAVSMDKCMWCQDEVEGLQFEFSEGLKGFLCRQHFWDALTVQARSGDKRTKLRQNQDLVASEDPSEACRLEQRLAKFLAAITRIEAKLDGLGLERAMKDWYTTFEVADLLGKAVFTVREWCRLGRINAAKRDCGRGKTTEWIVSHEELTRLRNHGLLPIPGYRHVR